MFLSISNDGIKILAVAILGFLITKYLFGVESSPLAVFSSLTVPLVMVINTVRKNRGKKQCN